MSRAGFDPVVIDDLSAGHRGAVKWGPLVVSDIGDRDAVKRTVDDHEITAAIHFAAYAYVGESVREPRRYFQNNVANTLRFLDALLDAGVKHLVFSSSCAVYGVPKSVPITENHSKMPVSPYGDSKLFIERVLDWYGQAYGLRWACLRYFNAAGADPDGELGEVHDPETHLVPLAIEAAMGTRPPLEIYGTDYPTEDGTAVRDYVHVSDLADAHIRAFQSLVSGGENFAINLGSGRGTSVREVIRTVERISGVAIDVKAGPRRLGDPPVLIADSSTAQSLLGWHPSSSSLDRIVSTAWDWHRHAVAFKHHASGRSSNPMPEFPGQSREQKYP
jgi:UDP-arabinose 4-epimerase